jgi:hypothetical protein
VRWDQSGGVTKFCIRQESRYGDLDDWVDQQSQLVAISLRSHPG